MQKNNFQVILNVLLDNEIKRGIKMKKFEIILLISSIVKIILEALPYGAVLNFPTPEKTITQTFSYFSVNPFGYANFGPLLTAILSCIILIFAAVLVLNKEKLTKPVFVLAVISVITSIMPLFMGCYSIIGGIITTLCALEAILSAIILKKRSVL